MVKEVEKVRLDKWLWSVRIYKTRSLAAGACRNGNIKSGNKRLKPSYLLSADEHIEVKKGGFDLVFKVRKIISKRVSAQLAQMCYTNITSVDELNKFNNWFIGKARPEIRGKGSGRPTKKERREIDEFKEDAH